MNNVFLENSILGKLLYESVYEYYDEPRFFSVSSLVGNFYLCYWLGSHENFDKWLVFSASPERLDAIQNRDRCIRDSLLYQEGTISYIFTVPFEATVPSNFEFFDSEDIDKHITLPKRGLFISNAPDTAREKVKEEIEETSHEIHIDKVSKKARPLSMEQIMVQLHTFADLYSSFADQKDITSKLMPSHSRSGSFILSLDVESFNLVEPNLVGLFNLISDGEDLKNYIIENGIDASYLLNFFYSIADTNSVFDLKDNQTGESVIKLSSKDIIPYIEDVEFIHLADSSIRSSQVPQANDLNKLFEVIEKKSAGIYLSPDELKLTDRQIQYYLHAASTLGYVDTNWTVTALGRKIAVSDTETRFRLTAKSFTLSDCAQAWTSWANVTALSELEPNSASQFLIECCSTLSESTSRRRASTLVKWYKDLSPYFPDNL